MIEPPNPKPEIRGPKEDRNPKPESKSRRLVWDEQPRGTDRSLCYRISVFGLPSGFGLRDSDFSNLSPTNTCRFP
jgi:hypothetical protein